MGNLSVRASVESRGKLGKVLSDVCVFFLVGVLFKKER